MSLPGEAVATNLEGTKMNSPDKSGIKQIFAWKKISRPRFLAKIPDAFHKLSFGTL